MTSEGGTVCEKEEGNMTGGYLGKVLWVDLSRSKTESETLDEGMKRQFLGGYGICARTIFSRQPAGVDGESGWLWRGLPGSGS